MNRQLLRLVVTLAIVQVIVRAALPAPNPWLRTRRVPSGHVGSAVECEQHQVPEGRGEPRVALAGLVTGVSAGGPSAGLASVAGDSARARRGKRSRRRGCRRGVRWRAPGIAVPGNFTLGSEIFRV